MNELKITFSDWIRIGIVGVLFASLLSLLGYHLLSLPLADGAVFGSVLGGFIAFFSFLFVTLMNRRILPQIPVIWWNAIAALFSFFSGFMGSISAYFLLCAFPIQTVELFHTHPFQSSSIIGALTYLMGALIYRIVRIRNEKEELDRLFIHSRLASLETQLNPHFLFNSLNTFSEMIYQDPSKAEAAILKLSQFLRNTMEERSLIPFADELRNVRDYLDLENIRFGGALVLREEVPAQFRNVLVPKFSVQLLAENAIKHGFAPGTAPFVLHVTVSGGEKVHIHVSNNGLPITHSAYGIGLSNLQERLKYLCGGDVTIVHFDPPTYLIELKECHEHPDRR